jgi:hypothetical protein
MECLCISARAGSAWAALLALTALSSAAYGEAPDISGTYWASEYRARIEVLGGGDLPLTADGKAAYEKNAAGLKDGSIIDNARRYCVPDGLPRVLATPYPFEIFQAPPGQITIVHELNHQIRVIALDQPMPSEKELTTLPFYNGHSVGHFEGDTLVVETKNFKRETSFPGSSASMHLIERFTRTDPGTLLYEFTVDDPTTWTRPWSGAIPMSRIDGPIYEYACHEGNQSLAGILAGARADEKAAAAAAKKGAP